MAPFGTPSPGSDGRIPGSGSSEPTIGSLIGSADGGDAGAADALFSALYKELHRLARSQLSRSASDATLGTTSLLHEAFVEMAGRESAIFPDRGRFMGYAARVMRGLVIDYARSRQALKRGGEFTFVPLVDDVDDRRADPEELNRVSIALDELATADPLLAQVVDLKFFCGFSFAEIAAMRGQSERTVQRHWEKARIALHTLVRDGETS